jgi:hypothetical protein
MIAGGRLSSGFAAQIELTQGFETLNAMLSGNDSNRLSVIPQLEQSRLGGARRSFRRISAEQGTVQRPAAHDSAGGSRAATTNCVGLTLGYAVRLAHPLLAALQVRTLAARARGSARSLAASGHRHEPRVGRTTARCSFVRGVGAGDHAPPPPSDVLFQNCGWCRCRHLSTTGQTDIYLKRIRVFLHIDVHDSISGVESDESYNVRSKNDAIMP